MVKHSRKIIENIATLKLSDGASSQTLQIGYNDAASAGYDDGLDMILPPPIPNSEHLGYLKSPNFYGQFSRDIRDSKSNWNLVITKNCKLTFGSDIRYGNLAISGNGIETILQSGNSLELAEGSYTISRTSATPTKPNMVAFEKVYPNPFNSACEITVDCNGNTKTVRLAIYDIVGKMIRDYEIRGAGKHTLIWDGKDIGGDNVPSGIYFARILTDGNSGNPVKLLLVR